MSRNPQPAVYIRCLLQTLIASDMRVLGAIPVKQFLYNDLAELVLPASRLLQQEDDEIEIPSDPRFQQAKSMDGFVKRVAQVSVASFSQDRLNGLIADLTSRLLTAFVQHASIDAVSDVVSVILSLNGIIYKLRFVITLSFLERMPWSDGLLG